MMSGTTATSGTTNYYYYETGYKWDGTADNTAGNGMPNWFGVRSTNYVNGTMEIQRPNVAAFTTFQYFGNDSDQRVQSGGVHKLATAYDGIQFKNGTGTITGTVTCYGYRK